MADPGDRTPAQPDPSATPPPYVPPPTPYTPAPPQPQFVRPPQFTPPPRHISPPPKQGGVKSSTIIKLGAMGVLSTLVVGFCMAQNNYEEVAADCVDLSTQQPDGSYTPVDDDYCDDDDSHYYGSHGAYRWYYGGVRSGARIMSGTTVKPSDAQITTRSGKVVQRGGFGFHGSSGS